MSDTLTTADLLGQLSWQVQELRKRVGELERVAGSEAPHQPLMLREIETSLERQPCPSCSARNVFLAHTVMNNDARRHVECRICSMRGPVKCSEIEAVEAWNKLPRVEWQDISTAPKDGTMILAVRSGFKPTTVKWVDFDGYARFCEDPETFMNQDHFEQYFMGTDYAPDYWMPLPAPKEPL